MITLRSGHPNSSGEWYKPFDDEAVTFNGTAGPGLTASKVAASRMVAIRFIAGDGRLRFSGAAASSTEGVPVFGGDVEVMTKFEAENLSGIRVGATNLTGWATYYR